MFPYVTAKLFPNELLEPFVIGDESFVNGFHNRPLEVDKHYTFFVRAGVLSEDEVRVYITYLSKVGKFGKIN